MTVGAGRRRIATMGVVAQSVLCPVMVRREEPLAALEDALLESRRGHGRLVVVSGEAGIGKTRLATELTRQARRIGSAVLTGGCSEAELREAGAAVVFESIEELRERVGQTPLGDGQATRELPRQA